MNISWLIFVVCFRITGTARILGFFKFPSISHQKIFQVIWRELSLRGHDVTVITPNPLGDIALTNLTEIDVGFLYNVLSSVKFIENMSKEKSALQIYKSGHIISQRIADEVFKSHNVQKLLTRDEDYFDVILLQTLHPSVYALAAKFKAPVIGITSFELHPKFHDAVGNPTHPIISPDIYQKFVGKLSFFDKVQSLIFNISYRILYYWQILPEADELARKYFGNDMPYLGDIVGNTSLFLVNVNPIVRSVRPNVPNVIEINQIHIEEKKPLPQDIQDYLDSSPQGVIYFSLGSNIKSAGLNNKTRDTIVQALSELPFSVLWKWESDDLPNRPDNVLTRKWLPQQDILGHPNIKVFVTQGGLQSMEEAITNEVPMVGLPFITDQTTNVGRIVELGMGLGLNHETLTKDGFKNAVLEITTNKKYKEQVQKWRAILLDQPLKGVDKALWWIEYVIRHKGARHLRSAAADMTFFEYFLVDVIVFILLCVYLCVKSIVYSKRFIWSLLQVRCTSRKIKFK